MSTNKNWRAYLAPAFTAKGEEKKSPVSTHPAVALGLGDRITQRVDESYPLYEGVLVWSEDRDRDVEALARIAFPGMTACDHGDAAHLHNRQFEVLMSLNDPDSGFDDIQCYHVNRIAAHAQARNFHYIAERLILIESVDEGKYGPGMSR